MLPGLLLFAGLMACGANQDSAGAPLGTAESAGLEATSDEMVGELRPRDAPVAAAAFADAGADLSQLSLIIFGDSLSDQGRAYIDSARQCPKSQCGYALGRFTNYFNWIDYFLNDTSNSPSPNPELDTRIIGQGGGWSFFGYPYNRAFGGAAVVADKTKLLQVPPVENQVAEYLLRCPAGNASKSCPKAQATLAVLWGGANDYFYADAASDANALAANVVETLAAKAEDILTKGGIKNILMLNLPPLDLVPAGTEPYDGGKHAFYKAAIAAHNTALEAAYAKLKSAHADVTFSFFDVHNAMSALIQGQATIEGVTDFARPCVTAGFCFSIQQGGGERPAEPSRATCTTTPQCGGRAFMDSVHPTTVVHCAMARLLEGELKRSGYTGFQSHLKDCSQMADNPQVVYTSAATQSAGQQQATAPPTESTQ